MYDTDHYLPAAAQRRLDAVRARATSERSVRQMLIDQQRAAVERHHAAQGEVERVKRFLHSRAIAAEQAKADEVSAAAKSALDAINARIAACPVSASALSARVEYFMKGLRAPVKAKVTTFSPKRGEAPSMAVERLRAERASLLADLRECRAAPITSAEAKAIVIAQIDALAAQGAPSTLGVIEAGLQLQWPRVVTDSRISPAAGGLPGTLHLMCWLARDSLVERLCAEIAELSDDSRALSAAARAHRENELLTQILSAERAEAAAIWAAADSGTTIEFRSDCDLRGVLELADQTEVK
jgi:hypothetical protein